LEDFVENKVDSLVKIMIQLGESYDFNVGKRFFVMSYDGQFGEKYDSNLACYSYTVRTSG